MTMEKFNGMCNCGNVPTAFIWNRDGYNRVNGCHRFKNCSCKNFFFFFIGTTSIVVQCLPVPLVSFAFRDFYLTVKTTMNEIKN